MTIPIRALQTWDWGLPTAYPFRYRLNHYRVISWFDVKPLERLFEAYGWSSLLYDMDGGIATGAIKQMLPDCKHWDAIQNPDPGLTPAVQLVGWPPFLIRRRNRVEDLLEDIQRSTLVAKPGEATRATILDLRKVVHDELKNAKQQFNTFNAIRRKYAERKRDLAAVIQERHKAATAKGFRKMWSGNNLRNTQLFRKILGGVNKSFKNASPPPPGHQAKDLPDGMTTGPADILAQHQADQIQTEIHAVFQAAQQYTSSKKILTEGNDLVHRATDLSANCKTVVQTHTYVHLQPRNRNQDQKSAGETIKPLTNGLKTLMKGYTKLSNKFTQYAKHIYLLAVLVCRKYSCREDANCGSRRSCNPSAERLPHYLLPFESASNAIERQLCGAKDHWTKVGSRMQPAAGELGRAEVDQETHALDAATGAIALVPSAASAPHTPATLYASTQLVLAILPSTGTSSFEASCSTPARLLLRAHLLCIPAGLSKSGTLWSGPGSVRRLLNATSGCVCRAAGTISRLDTPSRVRTLLSDALPPPRPCSCRRAPRGLAPAALPFVPDIRMSGRRRGKTGWRNVVAYARGHALAPRRVTSAPDDAGRRLPRLLSALPFLLEVRMRRRRQVALRAQIPRSASIVSSSRVSGYVLVPRPPPVVTAGSNTRKAEMGECRNGEQSPDGYDF
ncbi:hypothetical protein B0H13DRAFT_2674175 [Mycena leptocephala]|nr:hypothetical protein B0H13DRAFT_2674175 [Mycena leptocephala]